MPLRNIFGRRTAGAAVQDENIPPGEGSPTPGFERVDTVGSKASSGLSIRSVDTGSYKLSVVNDSGVYLPPSPTDETSDKSLWPRRYLASRTSSDNSNSGDIEHFSISRESFDSYRRSFDISARAPISSYLDSGPTRQSLDSSRFPRAPLRHARFSPSGTNRRPTTEEERERGAGLDEDFEEVGLDADPSGSTATLGGRPRRKFFGMFESQDGARPASPVGGASTASPPPSSSGVSRLFAGRKRGQSGAGAELRPMGPPPAGTQEAAEVQAVH